jgi:hypothetical protein
VFGSESEIEIVVSSRPFAGLNGLIQGPVVSRSYASCTRSSILGLIGHRDLKVLRFGLAL